MSPAITPSRLVDIDGNAARRRSHKVITSENASCHRHILIGIILHGKNSKGCAFQRHIDIGCCCCTGSSRITTAKDITPDGIGIQVHVDNTDRAIFRASIYIAVDIGSTGISCSRDRWVARRGCGLGTYVNSRCPYNTRIGTFAATKKDIRYRCRNWMFGRAIELHTNLTSQDCYRGILLHLTVQITATIDSACNHVAIHRDLGITPHLSLRTCRSWCFTDSCGWSITHTTAIDILCDSSGIEVHLRRLVCSFTRGGLVDFTQSRASIDIATDSDIRFQIFRCTSMPYVHHHVARHIGRSTIAAAIDASGYIYAYHFDLCLGCRLPFGHRSIIDFIFRPDIHCHVANHVGTIATAIDITNCTDLFISMGW